MALGSWCLVDRWNAGVLRTLEEKMIEILRGGVGTEVERWERRAEEQVQRCDSV